MKSFSVLTLLAFASATLEAQTPQPNVRKLDSLANAPVAANRVVAEKLDLALKKFPALRDVQFAQSLDYPTIDVTVDREKAGVRDVAVERAAKSIVAAELATPPRGAVK